MIKDNTPLGIVAEKYGMSVRTQNILKTCDINTFGEFMRFFPAMTIRNMGKNSYQEIIRIQDLCKSEMEEKRPTKEIDWEEVRIKAAIQIMKAAITADWYSYIRDDKEQADIISKNAVLLADTLIAELKKNKEQ